MDQGGGLERLTRHFPGQLVRGQAAQLVVDERQQLAGGLGVALRNGVQRLGDGIHSP